MRVNPIVPNVLLLVVAVLASACSRSALPAGDAATETGTPTDTASSVDSGQPEIPADARLAPPMGITFPDAAPMTCGGDAGRCDFPPSACAAPDCTSTGCPGLAWIVYFDNPTCVSGQCVFTKRYFQCSNSMACLSGGCISNVTIP
jgi:hypothetical protein